MKVVINKCPGGFRLSPAAILKLWEMGMPGMATPASELHDNFGDDPLGLEASLATWRNYLSNPIAEASSLLRVFSPDETLVLYPPVGRECRAHPLLVQVVEEMGEKANGQLSELAVVEIPDGVEFTIASWQGNGNEHIAEKHRTWS